MFDLWESNEKNDRKKEKRDKESEKIIERKKKKVWMTEKEKY